MATAEQDPSDSLHLNNLTQQLAKLKMPVYHTYSEHWVDIMHINNPHSFYARPTMFRPYMEFIEAKGDRILLSELQIMMGVVFYSEQSKRYVRGQINAINEAKTICAIHAIDYGFTVQSVSIDHIYYPYQELNLQPLVVHCQLADCEPLKQKEWDPEVTETMKDFVIGERAKMTVRTNMNGKYLVELRNSNPDDIATLLVYIGDSHYGFAQSFTFNKIDVPRPQKHFFPNKELKVGDTLHVRSMHMRFQSLSAFYVAEVQDYKEYLEEKSNFNMFSKQCQKLSTEDLKEGNPVSVYQQSDNKYERAIIKKVTDPDGKAIVYLIDRGETQEVGLFFMRNMSDKYFSRPPVAIFCSVQENQRFDYRLDKYLYPGFEFLITIKETGNMFDESNIVHISPLPK